MTVGGRLRRLAAVPVLACLLLLGVAGRAAAHAALLSSSPADGAVVAAAPREVVLTFGEAVSVPPEGVRVLGPAGLRVDDRRPGHAGGDGRTARVGLAPRLAEGTYVVSWRVVSADSHPVSGGFTFSVGHLSAAPAVTAGGGQGLVGAAYEVGRGVAYAGFLVLAGGAFFAAACRAGAPAPPALRRLLALAWAALLAATALLLVLRTPYESGAGFGAAAVRETLGGRPAQALVVRLLLVAALGGVLRRAAAGAPSRALAVAAGAAAVGTAATWAAVEHASAGPQPALAVPLDLLHLLAAAVWLGGLAGLLVTLAAEPLREAAGAAVRFSRAAQGAVAVLAATGAYQAWRQVGSWHALGATGYGRLLLAKLAAVAVLLAVAGYSRRWTARAADGGVRRLRWSVAAEAGTGALVLALTVALTSTRPARTEQEVAAVAAAPAATVYAEVPFDTGAAGGRGRGTVAVVMDPGRPGDNSLQAVVLTRGGALGVVPELRIRLALPERAVGPLEVPLTQRGAAWEADDLRLPLPGRWTMTVVVRTSRIDEDTETAQVEIPARTP